MDEDFKDFLKEKLMRGLRDLDAEREQENKNGGDTITITRRQFEKTAGKLFGVEASDTDKDHKSVKIGRLAAIETLLGSDKYKKLSVLIILLFEEYLFGVNGKRSEFRIDEGKTEDEPSEDAD